MSFSRHPSALDPNYTTVHKQHIPSPLKHLAIILVLLLIILIAGLIFTPWVQTVSGYGQITALEPENRQQAIHTLVAGRIDQWFVRDGDRVKKGDPIVRIIDNDPNLVERLKAELDAVNSQVQAAELATTTAEIDYRRKRNLLEQGLVSQREYEQAQIKVEELRAKEAAAQASISRVRIQQAQLSQQLVVAPQDGFIVGVDAGDVATYLSRGATIATFLPENGNPAVELWVSGRDIPLVQPGRKVRLQFDGWPAVQFSGWPSVAIGTFGGEVAVIDATANTNGLFRVLIIPDGDDQGWPDKRFLRFGAKARGWIQLNTVSLGFELWRQLNQFPPNFTHENQSESSI